MAVIKVKVNLHICKAPLNTDTFFEVLRYGNTQFYLQISHTCLKCVLSVWFCRTMCFFGLCRTVGVYHGIIYFEVWYCDSLACWQRHWSHQWSYSTSNVLECNQSSQANAAIFHPLDGKWVMAKGHWQYCIVFLGRQLEVWHCTSHMSQTSRYINLLAQWSQKGGWAPCLCFCGVWYLYLYSTALFWLRVIL